MPRYRHIEKTCVILIGMSGAGKSTVGVVLAMRPGMCFVDSDLEIQDKYVAQKRINSLFPVNTL